jgi:hypothetical protein
MLVHRGAGSVGKTTDEQDSDIVGSSATISFLYKVICAGAKIFLLAQGLF